MQRAPISSPKWQMYGITAPISPTAQKISYGLAFVGEGQAAIDDVTLTPTGGAAKLSYASA